MRKLLYPVIKFHTKIISLNKLSEKTQIIGATICIAVSFAIIGVYLYTNTPQTRYVKQEGFNSVVGDVVTKPKDSFSGSEKVSFLLHIPKQQNQSRTHGFLNTLLSFNLSAFHLSFVRTIHAQEGHTTSPLSTKVFYGSEMKEIDSVVVNVNQQDDQSYLVNLEPKNGVSFRPGTYALEVTTTVGGETKVYTQDFSWGVLAINTNKGSFRTGETVKFGMTVLNSNGTMVCDSKLILKITHKKRSLPNILREEIITDELSTENGKIVRTDDCSVYDVNERDDFETEYQVNEEGIYTIELTAENEFGTYTVTDSFEVTGSVPFDIERITRTRVYPVKVFPVEIKITANQYFEGTIEETVPDSFSISQLENINNTLAYSDIQSIGGGLKKMIWNVKLQKGETITLGYQYDAPDISPQFYLLGSLQLRSGQALIYQEYKPFQLANDAVVTWDGGGGADTNWSTCANWTSDTCPTASDVATFDATSTNNSTVDASFAGSVAGVDINTGYTGTITLARSLTVGSSHFDMAAGTFDSGANTLDVNGNFTLSNGSFTAPSGTMSITGSLTVSGGTFTHNSGTVTFDGTSTSSTSINAPSIVFNLVTINRTISSGLDPTLTIAANTTIPLGDNPTLTLHNTAGNGHYSLTNNGTITVGTGTWTSTVDANLTNNGTITGNITTWNHAGGFINNSTATLSNLSTLDINNSTSDTTGFTNNNGATFNTSANPTFRIAGSLTIDPGSTITANITLQLDGNNIFDSTVNAPNYTFATPVTISRSISSGLDPTLTIAANTTIPLGDNPTLTLNNTAGNGTYTLINNGTITVGTGTWTTNLDGTFTNNGTISGNVTTWTMNGGLTNSGSISLSSTVSVDISTFGEGGSGNFTNNASSSVTLASNPTVNITGSFTVNSSSTFPSPISLTLDGSSGTQTLNAPNVTYTSVTKSAGSTLSLSHDITTGGFTFSGGTVSNPASAYTITNTGNFSQSSSGTFGGANLTLEMSGSSNQTISHSAGTFSSVFKVNKSGGTASLSTSFTVTTQNCTVSEGIFVLGGNSFTCGGTFTVEDGGTLRLVGNEGVTTPTLNSGSTVEYVGDGDSLADTYQIKNWTYHHLTVNFTDTNDTLSPDPPTAPSSNLAAYWAMDEASWTNDCSTTTVNDSSSNNNDGKSCPASTGPTGGVAGKSGNGGSFDGTNDYIDIGIGTSLSMSQYTVSAWVNIPSNLSTAGRVVSRRHSSQWDIANYLMTINTSGLIDITHVRPDNTIDTATSTTDLRNKGWKHVLGLYDGSNIKLYVDGILEQSKAAGNPETGGTQTLLIGADPCCGATSLYLNGLIDEVRIYSTALSAGDVNSLANEFNGTISSLDINGNLTISSGTFTAPSTITLAGNFTNNATFNHNSGTVIIDGSGTSTFDGSSSPAITFNNLTSTTAGKTLAFTSGKTFRINGTLTLTGQSTNKVTVKSTTSGSQWNINHQGSESVTYTTVMDSGCDVSSTDITVNYTNTNGGNNGSCWLFDPTVNTRIDGNLRIDGSTRIK